MTVHVLMNVYQEADNLPRSIQSVRDIFGREVTFTLIDGKYPDYPDDSDFSTDGTEDIARANGFYLPIAESECEKRTVGLAFIDSFAEPGDWVLYLDADETINTFSGWPTARVGKFDFIRTSDKRQYGRCRLYRWEPGLDFKHRHYDLYDRNGELVASLATAPDYELIGSGVHHDTSHDATRMAKKRRYYDRLTLKEAVNA